MKRIVIKVGTQVLVSDKGYSLKEKALKQLTRYLVSLHKDNVEVVLVSSGAVALGRSHSPMQDQRPPMTSPATSVKQAWAAIGQSRLIHAFDERLNPEGITTAQILITALDLAQRESYLNLKETFETLLQWKVIPIVNENDSVSTYELKEYRGKNFGDNDVLSALVSIKLKADLLILLTSVDGIYSSNPAIDKKAKKIKIVDEIEQLKSIDTVGKSHLGRGGMDSKIEACRMASLCGVTTWVTELSQLSDTPISYLINKELDFLSQKGTIVLSNQRFLGKKKWISSSAGFQGMIIINEGAKKALLQSQGSLLAVGIVKIKGEFQKTDNVSIRDEADLEIGRGLVRLNSQSLREWSSSSQQNMITSEKKKQKKSPIVIHRDEMVLFIKGEVTENMDFKK